MARELILIVRGTGLGQQVQDRFEMGLSVEGRLECEVESTVKVRDLI
jgi:hypothetical protein